MTIKRLTGLSSLLAFVFASAAVIVTVTSGSANAMTQDRIVVGQNESVETEFGPIVSSNPSGEAIDPDTCAVSTYCDLVPVTFVVPPDIDPDAEYFVAYKLSWETEKLPPDPVLSPEGGAANDMDTYVYTDPATPEEAESRGHSPDSPGNPYIANSASFSEPEQTFLFKPKGDYLIVVSNYLGANQGYTITLTWVSESFPTPFEALAPEFRPSTTTTTTTTAPTTTTTAPPVTQPVVDNTPTTLAPVAIGSDDDFALGDFDTSDFDDQLQAPPEVALVPIARVFETPSTLALVLWMLALPFAILAISGGVIMRRRASLLSG